MQAQLIDPQEPFEVEVQDQQDVTHTVVLGADGSVKRHEQEDYQDDTADRTPEEAERLQQALQYARWHVYRETEYDPVPAGRNPDRIAATTMALNALPYQPFEDTVGDLFHQIWGHHGGFMPQPLTLEDAVPDDNPVVYKLNLYLEDDVSTLRRARERHAQEIAALATDDPGDIDAEDVLREFDDETAESFGVEAKAAAAKASDYTIESASELYYIYFADGEKHTVENDDPRERRPDTVLQMPILPIESMDEFKTHLYRHLACQIRDCYLGMGVEPPEPYRVVGFGIHEYTEKYEELDIYELYFDPEADLDGYTV